MAVTYVLDETFDGTRTSEMPDPDNEGETISTTATGIKDIMVTFTCDDTDPACVHKRSVNVCFAEDGTTYDAVATAARIVEVGNGVSHKIAVGVIS
tara:strand:- start:1185 stop:1472 length:288 start_codon:yes stop_codon:yes gene_type:complete